MPNWCNNCVQFIGPTETIETMGQYFEKMAEKEKLENKGQLPEFATEEDGWLFEIRWEDGTLNYETRWAQNSVVIKLIADHFKVDFVHSFDELMMQIYGEVEYKNGELFHAELESEDFDLFTADYENGIYVFEGETYDSEYEILEILLERKKGN